MDPRYPALPFSHPQPQQTPQELRYGPIPPSPFASQPSQRTDTLHKNDPFLRRRVDLEEQRRSPSLTNVPQSYILPHALRYPSTSIPTTQEPTTSDTQLRRSSFSAAALWGDARGDRLALHAATALSRDRIPLSLPSAPPLGYGALQQTAPAQEDTQRRKISQASPPSLFATTDHHPPPLFTGRQMLPPSPHTTQAQHHPQTLPARTPASTSFLNGRDLPAPPSLHRPSSSMSISSMLDSNPATSSRDNMPNGSSNAQASAGAGLVTSPTRQQGQAASPPHSSQAISLLTGRSTSPEKYKVHQSQPGRPFRSYSGDLGQRPPSLAQPTSPEALRNASLSGSQTSQHSPSFSLGVHRGWQSQEGRRLPDGRIVHRPSSQPSGHRSPPRDTIGRSLTGNPDRMHQYPDARRRYLESDQGGSLERVKMATGDPRVNDQPQGQAFSAPEAGSAHPRGELGPKQERTNGSSYPFASRSIQNCDSKPAQGTDAIRSGITRGYDREPQPLHPTQSPFSPESLRRLQKERHVLQQQASAHSPSKYSRAATMSDDKQLLATAENSASFPANTELSKEVDGVEHHHFRDDTNGHRKSSLAMLMENNRRGGRFSPLPQAVQGAQGRTNGPASDPGIKNEFARMFSGIGSGVGSAGPTGSGTSTPFAPPSPTMSHEQRPTPLHARSELGIAKPTTSSRGGKRSRKARDVDTKAESVDGEAGVSSATGPKAVKRSRTNHHHSHLAHHRHHHHADEADRNNDPSTPTVLNGRRVNTPAQATSATAPYRHHHHPPHHLPHHRHHQEVRPPPIPTTTINSEALLASVQNLPRVHLGSTVYSSSLEPATSAAIDFSKFGYLSTPHPLPRYEGKENCTYTVQIPRFYLTAQEREEICRRRALWGTDVYTDDSDPLAAAIHAGWIRGEFGEDVDPAMLELPNSAKSQNQSAGTTVNGQGLLTSQPAEPTLPPPNKDLYLTLLILPPLEKYASHIAHGIKSRSWGNAHDGMSFKILSMEWVDGHGEERSGQARRNRMRTLLAQPIPDGPAIRPYRGTLGVRGGRETVQTAVAVGV